MQFNKNTCTQSATNLYLAGKANITNISKRFIKMYLRSGNDSIYVISTSYVKEARGKFGTHCMYFSHGTVKSHHHYYYYSRSSPHTPGRPRLSLLFSLLSRKCKYGTVLYLIIADFPRSFPPVICYLNPRTIIGVFLASFSVCYLLFSMTCGNTLSNGNNIPPLQYYVKDE